MITYGYSIQGKSHIQRGVVCQDSSKVQRLRANVYMGIVADGVGSAAHSDIGSKMAVDALASVQEVMDHALIRYIAVIKDL